MAQNDDGSDGPVSLGFTVNFYGSSFSELYVNNNGNVTFDYGMGIFTPVTLAELGMNIIAPFWADVDTRNAGSRPVCYGRATLGGRSAFGVDWVDVGYYFSHSNKLLSAQLVLIDRSDTGTGNFDVEFNYCKVQWEAGDFSGGCDGLWSGFDCDGLPLGGSPARAGFAAQSGSAFEITGSGAARALLDSNLATGLIHRSFNSALPGRYLFQFRDGVPLSTP